MSFRSPLLFIAVAALGAAACSGSDAQESSSSAPPAPAEATAPAATDVYPLTLEHAFGETTLTEQPTRVVTLGVTDADPVLALGTVPLAVTGYSFYPSGLGPWTDDLITGDAPARLESDSEPNIEEIAALRPDLIIGISAGFDEATYDQLSEVAPTLARPVGSVAYTVPREDATQTIAAALGKQAEGEELNERTADALAQAREQNPGFDGRTGSVVLPFDGRYGVYTPGDARGDFLADLGFVPPPAVAALDPGTSFFQDISREQVSLLDGDVLVMLADQPAQRQDIADDEVLQNVPVVSSGRMILTDLDTRGAMTYNSVLSVPFALERLVPQLQDALAMTTEPEPAATP